MKIRIMCTPDEAETTVARLRREFDVQEVSEPRPNRGTSTLVRVYVECASPLTDGGPQL